MRCFNCGKEGAAVSQFRTCSNGTHTICVGCDHDGVHGRYQCPDVQRWNTYGTTTLHLVETRGHVEHDSMIPLAS